MDKSKRPGAHGLSVHKIGTPPRSPDPDDATRLLDIVICKAQSYANKFDLQKSIIYYDHAIRLCERQTIWDSAYPQLIELLQTSAYILIELGKKDEAKKRLLRILLLTEKPPHQTLMYMAQLSEGRESLDFYRKGLDAIHRESSQAASSTTDASSSASASAEFQSLGRAESNAWCAIAELYMTDLCDESDAQTECKRAFEAAIQVDPMNPQAWLTAADYYTVIEEEQDARNSIQRCLDLWWSKLENFLSDSSTRESNKQTKERDSPVTLEASGDTIANAEPGLQVSQADDDKKEHNARKEEDIHSDLEDLTGISSFGLLSLTRMMIHWEMWEKCATLLEALLEEDEDNIEVHYLLTEVGRHLWKDDDPQLLRYYALQTKIVAAKLGNMELVEDMEKLLLELPPDDEPKSDESADIPSTDDDDENNGDSQNAQ